MKFVVLGERVLLEKMLNSKLRHLDLLFTYSADKFGKYIDTFIYIYLCMYI